MEISKSMFCYDKTNRKAGIGKIVDFKKNNNVFIEHKNDVNSVSKGNVVASFDIIDLIEPGDFINGYKVTYIDKDNQIIRVDGFGWGTNIIRKDNIKNIVIKEQFESKKYEVK